MGSKQRRRGYAKQVDPRAAKQRRCRVRLATVSADYSERLTDAQQDACIAAGVKLGCRPRLGTSGRLTGQQYLVHMELAGKAAGKAKKATRRTQVPQLQRVTKKFASEVPQPQ